MRRVSAVWGRTLVEHVVLEDVLADLGGDGGAPVAGADECDLLGHAWLLSVVGSDAWFSDRAESRRRQDRYTPQAPAVCDGWPAQERRKYLCLYLYLYRPSARESHLQRVGSVSHSDESPDA